MFFFAVLTMCSLVMYVYYKVSILRSKDSLAQKYTNGKSKVALGLFLISFAINQYIAAPLKIILFISLVFIFLGVLQVMDGYKRARHYRREWRRLYPKESK